MYSFSQIIRRVRVKGEESKQALMRKGGTYALTLLPGWLEWWCGGIRSWAGGPSRSACKASCPLHTITYYYTLSYWTLTYPRKQPQQEYYSKVMISLKYMRKYNLLTCLEFNQQWANKRSTVLYCSGHVTILILQILYCTIYIIFQTTVLYYTMHVEPMEG